MSNNECNPNLTLIYEYAAQALKDLDLSINRLNTKLGVVLGFDAALIRFFQAYPIVRLQQILMLWIFRWSVIFVYF